MRSAGRIERLLRSKRRFGELWNQKGECVIPFDKQLCSFPRSVSESQVKRDRWTEVRLKSRRRRGE